MTKTRQLSECDVATKAAKLNLTVDQMVVMIELTDDIEQGSGGAIQGMVLHAVDGGTELKLHSWNATYYVWLVGNRLACVREPYGRSLKMIHESGSESVSGWEQLRDAILRCEGYEVQYEQFDTASNSTINRRGDSMSEVKVKPRVRPPVMEDDVLISNAIKGIANTGEAPIGASSVEEPIVESTIVDSPIGDSSVVEDEVSRLQRAAQEAAAYVRLLESKRQDALREFDRMGDQINEARRAAEIALHQLRAVKPVTLPPVPSFKEILAEARRQRPDANDRETVRMAAMMHSTMSDGLAQAGDNLIYNRPIPEITGSEVRNVADHTYEITGPEKDAQPGQSRPSSVKREIVKRYD